MNESEIEQFTQDLLKLREELLALEKSAKDAVQPVELDQSGMGRLSRMDALQAQQMAQESARRRKRQLQKIDGALRRIKLGEYGKCFICEETIDIGRLAVDPTITRCKNCVEDV